MSRIDMTKLKETSMEIVYWRQHVSQDIVYGDVLVRVELEWLSVLVATGTVFLLGGTIITYLIAQSN